MARSTTVLDELSGIAHEYGRGIAKRKAELLDLLADARLPSARSVHRLHEVLLLLRAYPDDEAVLERVDSMLDGFAERSDLQRFSEDLADSGIAGTPLHYRFFWGMAAWLAERWPALLHIDWSEVDDRHRIERVTLQPSLTLWVAAPTTELGVSRGELVDPVPGRARLQDLRGQPVWEAWEARTDIAPGEILSTRNLIEPLDARRGDERWVQCGVRCTRSAGGGANDVCK